MIVECPENTRLQDELLTQRRQQEEQNKPEPWPVG